MQKIEAGMYEATIVDYGIGLTKAGDPQVMIRFGFTDQDGDLHELNWYGSLKEGKAQEITCKALLACGMQGNDLNVLADGPVTNALDVSTNVRVTVVHEEKQDGSGTQARIKWVNPLGGLTKKITKSEANVKLGALNLKAAMMAARSETGIKERAPKQTASQNREPGEDDEFSWGV